MLGTLEDDTVNVSPQTKATQASSSATQLSELDSLGEGILKF